MSAVPQVRSLPRRVVWLVDDDRSIRFVLEKALSGAGFMVESFDAAEPALRALGSRTPDLVDEHFYRNMEEMMAQSFRYDAYSRTNPTGIFCGEWATRVGSPAATCSAAT